MSEHSAQSPTFSARPFWVDCVLLVQSAVIIVTLVALGNWQMRRLTWKLDLIEAVETRAFAPPVAAPNTGAVLEYQRVYLEGTYLHDDSLRIKAVTDLGPGYWLLTPLDGSEHITWVNRGFLPTGLDGGRITQPAGPQRVEGLLRLPKSKGTWLEKNDPGAGRWFSADLHAMNHTLGLPARTSYFVDADHTDVSHTWPRGGLTQVSFRNNHLSYALTWYAMALLLAAMISFVIYQRVNPDL